MSKSSYAALQLELIKLNLQFAKLLDIFSFDNCDLNVWSESKASTFADTDVPCQGFNLIQVSTDGDLSDISYKLVQLDGRDSHVMQASESPHIIGPVTAIKLTNVEAEAGKTVRVARYRIPLMTLAAVKHGTPQYTSLSAGRKAFYAEKVEYASSASNYFESDQPLGTTPTLSINGVPSEATKIMIHSIRWQFTPTNAVTYQLYLLDDAQAVDERSESDVFFDSGAGLTSGGIYIQVAGGSPAKLPVQVKLSTAGVIYYLIDWSAAPGDTIGYIKIYGEVLV